MQLQAQQENEQMAVKLKFISKVTNMGERTMVIFPKEHDKESKRLRGKFARITVEEIPVEVEEEKTAAHR
jgi:hypothetical protein